MVFLHVSLQRLLSPMMFVFEYFPRQESRVVLTSAPGQCLKWQEETAGINAGGNRVLPPPCIVSYGAMGRTWKEQGLLSKESSKLVSCIKVPADLYFSTNRLVQNFCNIFVSITSFSGVLDAFSSTYRVKVQKNYFLPSLLIMGWQQWFCLCRQWEELIMLLSLEKLYILLEWRGKLFQDSLARLSSILLLNEWLWLFIRLACLMNSGGPRLDESVLLWY
jgi:hypothetical protein